MSLNPAGNGQAGQIPSVPIRDAEYQRVQDFIDSCSEIERQVAILRLCRMDNDGSKHFDHGEPSYSWACLACQQMGRGALGGWVGALQMLGTLNDGPGCGP